MYVKNLIKQVDYLKMKIKKIIIIIVITFIFSSIYCDDNRINSNLEFNFKTKLLYNLYGPNYQGYGPYIGKSCKLEKNDKLIIEVSGISDKDIPKLYFSIVDRNPSLSYWCNIIPKNKFYIENLKANKVFSQVFETEVIDTPYSMKTTCFVFMHESMNIKTVKLSSCRVAIKIKD